MPQAVRRLCRCCADVGVSRPAHETCPPQQSTMLRDAALRELYALQGGGALPSCTSARGIQPNLHVASAPSLPSGTAARPPLPPTSRRSKRALLSSKQEAGLGRRLSRTRRLRPRWQNSRHGIKPYAPAFSPLSEPSHREASRSRKYSKTRARHQMSNRHRVHRPRRRIPGVPSRFSRVGASRSSASVRADGTNPGRTRTTSSAGSRGCGTCA